jgi:serine/threonine protein kinase
MALDKAGLPGYAAIAVICQTGDFEVYRALSPNREQVLLKVPAPSCPPAKAIQQLEHELEIARELDPAFAVRPLRIERAARRMALLLEDFPCHALSQDLTAPLDLGQFFKIAIGVTRALAALHLQGMVHKDVKPECAGRPARSRRWESSTMKI